MGVYLGSQSVSLRGGQPASEPSPSGGGEPKNVNFYDYEGTLLHSYTTQEWASVTELPANPTHEGLTAQGWNWSKADIDDYVSDYPKAIVNVGQMYITDDGKTRIYVHFEKGRTSPYLGLWVNGTVEIDWGDGSATDTLTGTSMSNLKTIQHIYQPGDYIIKLTPTVGSFLIMGSTNSIYLLCDVENKMKDSRIYSNGIKKIEIGESVSLGSRAFVHCNNLSTITCPRDISIAEECFRYCTSLKCFVFPILFNSSYPEIKGSMFYECNTIHTICTPYTLLSVGTSAFYKCWSLLSLTIPKFNDTWDLYTDTFRYCYSLATLIIPQNVQNIYNSVFSNCCGMKEYHFLSTNPPTVSNASSFANMASDCIIYVPNESVEAYKTATNWSNYASYIQGE